MKEQFYEAPAVRLYELTIEGVMCQSGNTERWNLQGLTWDDETE